MSGGLDFIRSISKKEAATSWRREKKYFKASQSSG